MKYMTINNQKVAFDDEKNVLSVIRKAGINLPTFCYHSGTFHLWSLSYVCSRGDRGKIFASCSEVPRDGMVLYQYAKVTASPENDFRINAFGSLQRMYNV